MTVVIVGMLAALLIAGVVVALVAVPARRDGREVLSAEGEQIVQAALERTADAVGVARDKVGDLAEKLPVTGREPAREPARGGQHALRPDASIDLRSQQQDSSQHSR